MLTTEMVTWLGSHANEDLIRLARSVPFTVKLDLYQMHAMALVLATRLELAEQRRDEIDNGPLDGFGPDNAGWQHYHVDCSPEPSKQRSAPEYRRPVANPDALMGPFRSLASTKFPTVAELEQLSNRELAERASDWQVP